MCIAALGVDAGEREGGWLLFLLLQLSLGPLVGGLVGWLGGRAVDFASRRDWMEPTFQRLAAASIAILAFACAEAKSRYNLANVGVSAVASGDGYRLDGEKIAVLNGHCADHLLVVARTSGKQRDEHGISLFVVDANSDGVQRRSYPLVDGTRGADIQFEGVQLGANALLGELDTALPLIEDVVAQALVAMGAEAVGAMDALLEQTVEYTKTREQFGQPIGKFQALQHRMADMYLQCQSLRSLNYYAAICRDEQRPDMVQAASGLKVKLAEASRFVSQQAVQLHGGIGMTDELGISHYFKRLLLLNTLFGDGEHHLERYLQA